MRLRIDLGYDGGGFYGWARQPQLRTVQGEIEQAIRTVLHLNRGSRRNRPSDSVAGDDVANEAANNADATSTDIRLVVAGRTDTGVHALHQVCHLDIDERLLARCVGHMNVTPVVALERRLQRVLPDDIAIHRISEAPEGFDARFSALERTYVYRVCDNERFVDPRTRGFVVAIDERLNVDAMNEAAALTIGLHDFGSFATPNPGGTTIREVKYARWERADPRTPLHGAYGEPVPYAESGLLCFTIVADAFARNMVRSLVNGCLQVGRGRKTVAWFAEKMAEPKREGSTGPAAAKGLTLEYVAYPPDDQLAARAQAIRAVRTL
ncbi:tRNA pseudouridine(38-40) synthase TruA [Bifidobacterium sp. 82T24]|uniref:tRNA pseudouridine(38-40) synthase TruA n=1 Tax=Bifidobacterium pluvialisilvae TaxID=2834436 RepID=UPI001C55EC42|nr:tRNA pseudouridine(38-40) synthase TruA [Bifidobacterium pluvialisilvae]MBW3087967.1 tRNA pseudouridine(38-40) synthase TruA [Bifidobacterium pluvialisilvae]